MVLPEVSYSHQGMHKKIYITYQIQKKRSENIFLNGPQKLNI